MNISKFDLIAEIASYYGFALAIYDGCVIMDKDSKFALSFCGLTDAKANHFEFVSIDAALQFFYPNLVETNEETHAMNEACVWSTDELAYIKSL